MKNDKPRKPEVEIKSNDTGIINTKDLSGPFQRSAGQKGAGAKEFSVSAGGQSFDCVNTISLTDAAGALKESGYTCANPKNESSFFRATVKHDPHKPK